MDETKKKFLEAEEIATNLAETLKRLYNETSSYKSSKEELNEVRKKLLRLIESTENVVASSHEVVKILKEIGGPEILDRLDKSKVLIENTGQAVNTSQAMVKDIRDVTQPEILNRLNKLKILVMITLGCSILAIIVGIISVVR